MQQTVTPEDRTYASKRWLVGSLTHLVSLIPDTLISLFLGRSVTGPSWPH
jgi:hypothetical protein